MASEILKDLTKLVEEMEAPREPAVAVYPLLGQSGVNPSDAFDALDNYIADLLDKLEQDFDGDEEDLLEVIWQAADSLVATGELPPIPEEGSPAQVASEWLGKAQSLGFGNKVMELAGQLADEEPEEAAEDEDEYPGEGETE